MVGEGVPVAWATGFEKGGEVVVEEGGAGCCECVLISLLNSGLA